MTAFDLKDIDLQADSERGAWLHVKDPRNQSPVYADGDESKPVRLHLRGPHAQAVQDATTEVQKAREKREADRTTFDKNGRVAEKGESTKEELEADDAKIYAAATIGWENMAYDGSEELDSELAERMYSERAWLGRQVYFFLLEHENFMTGRDSS